MALASFFNFTIATLLEYFNLILFVTIMFITSAMQTYLTFLITDSQCDFTMFSNFQNFNSQN